MGGIVSLAPNCTMSAPLESMLKGNPARNQIKDLSTRHRSEMVGNYSEGLQRFLYALVELEHLFRVGKVVT